MDDTKGRKLKAHRPDHAAPYDYRQESDNASGSRRQQYQSRQAPLYPPPSPQPQPRYAPPSSSRDAPPPAYTDEDAARLFSPSSISSGRGRAQPLRLPAVVPQVLANWDSPFLRAWSTELERSRIAMNDWLGFVDGLNVAMTSSPPLRVVDLAGRVIGFVPWHWAGLIGAGIQTGAQISAHIVSKSLTDRYLQRANRVFFEPRGLKVRLMKTGAVRAFVQRRIGGGGEKGGGKGGEKSGRRELEGPGEKGGLEKTGNVFLSIGRHVLIARRIIARFSKPPPGIAPGTDINTYRMAQFASYTLPLSTSQNDLPPPKLAESSSAYARASARVVQKDRERTTKADIKADRARLLLAIATNQLPSSQLDSIDPPLTRDEQKTIKEHQREVRKMTRKDGSLRREVGGPITALLELCGMERRDEPGPSTRLGRYVGRANRLEMRKNEDLVWVVLLNLDEDRLIEGRDKVDTSAEEEIIDSKEFDQEIREENKHEAQRRELEAEGWE